MSEREAVIRRRLSTFPMPIRECTSHIGVLVHGKLRSRVHEADSAGRCRACGWTTAAGAAMPIRPSRPWLGATPVFGMPHTASAGVGMYTSIPTPPGVAPGPAIPCGKATASRSAGSMPAARQRGCRGSRPRQALKPLDRPSCRPGREGDSTPAGGTDGVRAGGRGDRRRSGGNADHAARRSLRELSREAEGGTSGDGPTEGTFGPSNRERCRSGVCPGDRRGRSTPRQPAVIPGVCWLTDLRRAKHPLGRRAQDPATAADAAVTGAPPRALRGTRSEAPREARLAVGRRPAVPGRPCTPEAGAANDLASAHVAGHGLRFRLGGGSEPIAGALWGGIVPGVKIGCFVDLT